MSKPKPPTKQDYDKALDNALVKGFAIEDEKGFHVTQKGMKEYPKMVGSKPGICYICGTIDGEIKKCYRCEKYFCKKHLEYDYYDGDSLCKGCDDYITENF